jgi:hypothetical protein
MPILLIEALSDFLLFIDSIIILLMPLFTTVQLFIDRLLFALVCATMLSFVAIVVTTNLM